MGLMMNQIQIIIYKILHITFIIEIIFVKINFKKKNLIILFCLTLTR